MSSPLESFNRLYQNYAGQASDKEKEKVLKQNWLHTDLSTSSKKGLKGWVVRVLSQWALTRPAVQHLLGINFTKVVEEVSRIANGELSELDRQKVENAKKLLSAYVTHLSFKDKDLLQSKIASIQAAKIPSASKESIAEQKKALPSKMNYPHLNQAWVHKLAYEEVLDLLDGTPGTWVMVESEGQYWVASKFDKGRSEVLYHPIDPNQRQETLNMQYGIDKRLSSISPKKKNVKPPVAQPIASPKLPKKQKQKPVRKAMTEIRPGALENLKKNDRYAIANYNNLLQSSKISGQGTWLSDKEINDYMTLLQRRSDELHERNPDFYPKCKIYNSFVFKGDFQLKKALRAEELKGVDKVLAPLIVNDNHWVLMEIDCRAHTFRFYNSFGATHAKGVLEKKVKEIKDEIAEEVMPLSNRLSRKFANIQEWDIEFNNEVSNDDFPLQRDGGNNCGVFACKYAEWIVRNKGLKTPEECRAFMDNLMPEIIHLPGELDDGDYKYPEIRKEMYAELVNQSLVEWTN
jgi:hypothetical protein